jgi:hypothetical protein
MDDLQDLARLANALRPWLGELVIVGGWAHRLYRMLPNVPTLAYQPLRTRDADVAFSATSSLVGNMGAALKAAGFREELAGEHTPPVTWYRLGGDDQGFSVEFLSSLVGSGTKRDGTDDATLAKAGVTAQKLRYIDLLLTSPWTIHLQANGVVPIETPAVLRIPNPTSFIVQKLLIHTQRPPEKRAQDALYVHDTLDLFGGQLATLQATWRRDVRPTVSPKTAAQIERLAREQYGEVTDVLRAAARIPQDRTLVPERLQARCAYGLSEILSD